MPGPVFKIDWRGEFIMETYALAKTNPAVWSDFLVAFNNWVREEVLRGLNVPTAEAQMALGMGRALRDICNDFNNIEALAEKYKGRGKQTT